MNIAIPAILFTFISCFISTQLYLADPRDAKKNTIRHTASHILTFVLLIIALFLLGWKVFFSGLFAFFLSKLILKPLCIRVAAWHLRNTLALNAKFGKIPPENFIKLSRSIYYYYENPFSIKGAVADETKKNLIAVLISICYNLPQNREFIAENKMTKNDFQKIFNEILSEGGGLWVNRHFIPASAIAYPTSLNYLRICGIDSKTVNSLVMYFERDIPLGY